MSMYNDRRSQGVLPLTKSKKVKRLADEVIMQPGEQEKQVPIRGLYTVTRILKKMCVCCMCLLVSLRICCLALETSHGTGVWSFTWMACQAAEPSLDTFIVANVSQIYTLNFGVWMCQVSYGWKEKRHAHFISRVAGHILAYRKVGFLHVSFAGPCNFYCSTWRDPLLWW